MLVIYVIIASNKFESIGKLSVTNVKPLRISYPQCPQNFLDAILNSANVWPTDLKSINYYYLNCN